MITWPTSSGTTLAQATTYCNAAKSSPAGQACTGILSDDFTTDVQTCIDDVGVNIVLSVYFVCSCCLQGPLCSWSNGRRI